MDGYPVIPHQYFPNTYAPIISGMYCLNMLAIALEIAMERPVYEDIATKVFPGR